MTRLAENIATSLRSGQSRRTPVRAGAHVVVLAGKFELLEPPAWLGERVVVVRHRIGEGEAYRVDRGGWIELSATTAAEALLCAPRPLWDEARQAWRSWSARLLSRAGLRSAVKR